MAIVKTSLAESFLLFLGAVQCLGKAIDAIIVVSILQGARHVLVNVHIARHISQCVVLGKALPANRTNRTNAFRTLANSLVKQAYVEPANAFEVSIGDVGQSYNRDVRD